MPTTDPSAPSAATSPGPAGTLVQVWKQDPSVKEVGLRKVFLPSRVHEGPRDERIVVMGLESVKPDSAGDFVTMRTNSHDFDACHTFAVVRMTLTMYQRALQLRGRPAVLKWQWNNLDNDEPIEVFPHGLPNEVNAWYSRQDQALKFGDFLPNDDGGLTGRRTRVYTCRSLDVVAHETGHAILDGIKPGWMSIHGPPQTGALHEAFGDLTAMFVVLSQLDLVEQLIVDTKADLHNPNFLTKLAEQFGESITGHRENALRNADNNLTLDNAGTEVHDLSRVFTGAIFGILVDMFLMRRRPDLADDAVTLHDTAASLCGLLLQAIIEAPAKNVFFADVASGMRTLAASNAANYPKLADVIQSRFAERGVKLPIDGATGHALLKCTKDDLPRCLSERCATEAKPKKRAKQNREGCCATLQLHAKNKTA